MSANHPAPAVLSVSTAEESNFAVPDYGLDAEDADLAAEIANFDPLIDTKGPVSLINGDNLFLPSSLSVSALPPHLADPIRAQIAEAHPDKRSALEQELVSAALQQNSINLRIRSGAGEGANAYQREVFNQAKQIDDLDREEASIDQALAEVIRWDTIFDPVTGKATPKAVERIEGARRIAMEKRLAEIAYHREQLRGREGQNRLAAALKEAVGQRKAAQEQIEEFKEVRTMAKQIARDNRIRLQAETLAKAHTNHLGG